ncbi:hypothetical protein R84B8_01296 [Treponema sp. R8-4-B8]
MIDEKIIEGLREYIKDHYVPIGKILASPIAPVLSVRAMRVTGQIADEAMSMSFRNISNEATKYIKKHRKPEGFAHTLERLRKEKSLKPAELYKRANVDRRQYSRYMGPEGRHPSMNTVISFALALKLERAEFDKFLQTAGYSLSNASTRDVCVMYCLEKGIYDIDEVNALLFAIGIEPLSKDSNA